MLGGRARRVGIQVPVQRRHGREGPELLARGNEAPEVPTRALGDRDAGAVRLRA